MEMEFIYVPIVVAIITAGIYGLFELIIRRKERLTIIEKIGDKLDPSMLRGRMALPSYSNLPRVSYGALKAGCLIAGIGLGLLVGFIINASLAAGNTLYADEWYRNNIAGVSYGASVLLFGGIGLIIAFVVEMNLTKKKKEEDHPEE